MPDTAFILGATGRTGRAIAADLDAVAAGPSTPVAVSR